MLNKELQAIQFKSLQLASWSQIVNKQGSLFISKTVNGCNGKLNVTKNCSRYYSRWMKKITTPRLRIFNQKFLMSFSNMSNTITGSIDHVRCQHLFPIIKSRAIYGALVWLFHFRYYLGYDSMLVDKNLYNAATNVFLIAWHLSKYEFEVVFYFK